MRNRLGEKVTRLAFSKAREPLYLVILMAFALILFSIRKRLNDSQFAECELTIRDVSLIGEAIREAAIGFLGARIEYQS
jgi:di/tricarboxylate transporter